MHKKNKPQTLSLRTMYDELSPLADSSVKAQFRDGFALVLNLGFLFRHLIKRGQPYLLTDYRLGMLRQGRFRVIINLREYDVGPGTIVFITPGTIVEPLEVTDDFLLEGVGMNEDVFRMVNHGSLPPLFNGQLKHSLMQAGEEQQRLVDHLLTMLYETLQAESASREVAYKVAAALTHYYNDLFSDQQSTAGSGDSAHRLFDRFIHLVNVHCREQRALRFYADHLCVSEHYLSAVIRQTSGITSKEWVDRAVLTAAKVLLRHSNLQVVQIADELHFPTPSFFCKYFRRLAGCTPSEYRES